MKLQNLLPLYWIYSLQARVKYAEMSACLRMTEVVGYDYWEKDRGMCHIWLWRTLVLCVKYNRAILRSWSPQPLLRGHSLWAVLSIIGFCIKPTEELCQPEEVGSGKWWRILFHISWQFQGSPREMTCLKLELLKNMWRVGIVVTRW